MDPVVAADAVEELLDVGLRATRAITQAPAGPRVRLGCTRSLVRAAADVLRPISLARRRRSGQSVVVPSSRLWSWLRARTSRFSDWVVAHPVAWAVGSGAALVLLGLALDLSPVLVVGAAAAVGLLNVLHARRRGYCPVPTESNAHRRGD